MAPVAKIHQIELAAKDNDFEKKKKILLTRFLKLVSILLFYSQETSARPFAISQVLPIRNSMILNIIQAKAIAIFLIAI